MKYQLTVRKIEALKPKATRYRVVDGGGLLLEVLPSGAKIFRARVQENGVRSDITYGRYPDLSLNDARRMHEARAESRVERKEDMTLLDVFGRWIKHYATQPSPRTKRIPKPRTVHQVRKRFELYLHSLHDRPISRIKRGEILAVLDAMTQREEARGCFNILNVLFEYAVLREYVEYSPLAGVRVKAVGLSPKKPKQRHISAVQLAELWARCNDEQTGRAAKVLILTGARRSMVAAMRWEELDGEWWNIPGDKMKSYEPQSIYNTFAEIIEPLRLLQGRGAKGWVFESHAGEGHLRADSISTYLQRITKKYGWNFATHDIRRSVRTAWAEELKVPDHIAELMLAHKRDKLVGTYNKSLMLEDQKAAWVAWAALLERYRQWVALRDFVLRFFGHTGNC